MHPLHALEQAIQAELRAHGLFTFCSGLLLGTLISWVTATALTPTAQAVYVASSLVFTLGTAYFASLLWSAKKLRPSLLHQIRSGRATMTTTHEVRDL